MAEAIARRCDRPWWWVKEGVFRKLFCLEMCGDVDCSVTGVGMRRKVSRVCGCDRCDGYGGLR